MNEAIAHTNFPIHNYFYLFLAIKDTTITLLMISMKVHRLLKIFVLFCLTLICLIIWIKFQSPDDQRSKFCRNAKALTQITVNHYDDLGIYWHSGTFTRKFSLNAKSEIKVIIFPKALSSRTWSKVALSSIHYIGKGGDDSWKEWLRPDYFYLLEVPGHTTALAFGRLCFRNGDVKVEVIKKLTKTSFGKLIINDKIYLSSSFPLPVINESTIIVNTGSNHQDVLGTQTEVYFTRDSIQLAN